MDYRIFFSLCTAKYGTRSLLFPPSKHVVSFLVVCKQLYYAVFFPLPAIQHFSTGLQHLLLVMSLIITLKYFHVWQVVLLLLYLQPLEFGRKTLIFHILSFFSFPQKYKNGLILLFKGGLHLQFLPVQSFSTHLRL